MTTWTAYQRYVGFLECALLLTCHVLPEDMEHWPNRTQLTEDTLGKHESRQGVLWIMRRSDPHQGDPDLRTPPLQSRIYFSTSEYAQVPKLASDLLVPLAQKVQRMWDHNFREFQKRLSHMV